MSKKFDLYTSIYGSKYGLLGGSRNALSAASRLVLRTLLVCDFFFFLKSHTHQGQEQKCFLPPAEIIGISWHFGSFSFLANGKATW